MTIINLNDAKKRILIRDLTRIVNELPDSELTDCVVRLIEKMNKTEWESKRCRGQ